MPDPAAHRKTVGLRATDKLCHSQGLVLQWPAGSPADLGLISILCSKAQEQADASVVISGTDGSLPKEVSCIEVSAISPLVLLLLVRSVFVKMCFMDPQFC